MVWIVGAVCVDLVAMRKSFRDGTSNPSTFHVSVGGVGYNIFRHCSAPKRFITALGRDPISEIARDTLGGDPSVTIRECHGESPALYVAFMEDGRLKLGASDLSAVERFLDAQSVLEEIGEPGERDYVVLDGNLSEDTVSGVVTHLGRRTRVVFEPVSVEKAARQRASLDGCWLSTPAEDEAAAMVRGLDGAAGPLDDGEVFAYMSEAGIRNLLVTRSERGASLYRRDGRRDFAPPRLARTRDSTGAGDLLVSSLLGFLHEGRGIAESIPPAMETVERALEEGKS
jgi:sugar/nucleoside kinase (ribokinase family)